MKLKGKVKFINKDKSLFFPTLRKRVDTYFQENNLSKTGNASILTKSIILLLLYLVPFALLLAFAPGLSVSLLLWLAMGVGVAGVAMSVMHDANHGAFSKSKVINYLMAHSVNLLGGSAFNWRLQHNILHHTYTNVVEMDEDIDDMVFMRFSPHTKVRFYHKLQWVYAFLFYGLLTLYWVVLKDFVQFFRFIRNGVNANSKAQNSIAFTKIVVFKVLYFFAMLVAPTLLFGIPFWEVLVGFLLMHFVAGIILSTVFQLAHTVEGTSHPLPNASGAIENDWAIHQLNTTANFSRKSKLLSWYVGGLNFQIEHHLFPRICHVHYPALAGIVKETAAEYGIPYIESRTLMQAVRSHVNTLHRFGRLRLPSLNEIMA
ncbi:linoleoyl-CoA desaturase [Pontibacter ummariensis]|uniref:Linoleoyl-CoA desaturase n=1 Tax=Pontibacter ummariensis TaxID=1610492 RepID=A0A239D7J4_9BACT|nr:acyl-CoA desaturase [Pontibacter ummariensis]PRY14270.1 linoleoyl-CoA desaturase [Pontibacter ummariensis]SNS27844.1 linoleoyl-CoA desaturase [Pontibacter ummariensis]